MIIERIAILTANGNREEVRHAFSSFLGPTSVEPGCISCDLYQGAGNPNRISLETRWRTEQELIKHLRSDQFRNLLILLELSTEPPLIEFHKVVETKGLELVRSVREDTGAT